MSDQLKYIVDDLDVAILAAIEDGLPLCEKPYEVVADRLSITESTVLARLERMLDTGIIKRFGMVLQHRRLGFRANAMVVWDIPDKEVDAAAARVIAHDYVTLCYSRHRHLPQWRYNLFCMVHGRERGVVEQQIADLKKSAGLESYPSNTLFSLRRFKQRGARFSTIAPTLAEAAE